MSCAVGAPHRTVGRDDDDVEAVDLAELALLGLRRTGHPGELLVEPEIVLERDRGERLVLAADRQAFLRFDRLVNAVGIAAAVHEAPGELVDDDDFAVLDDVLLVLVEQMPRLERRVELVRQLEVALIVEVGDAEDLLDLGHTLFRDRNGVRLFIDREVLVLDQPRQNLCKLPVEFGRIVTLSADDERRARFVDQDRVDFVDDRVHERALHHVFDPPCHVVTQVVEADLVVRHIGDVGFVGRAAGGRVHVVLDHADRQAEESVERRHPLGVTLGKVIVDRDDVNARAGQRVEVRGKRGDQRLALAGPHLGDFAFVQHGAADDLNVEMAHLQRTLPGFASDRERFGQQVVQRRALREPAFELDRLGRQRLVGERLSLRFQRVDALDGAAQPPDLALVAVKEGLEKSHTDA